MAGMLERDDLARIYWGFPVIIICNADGFGTIAGVTAVTSTSQGRSRAASSSGTNGLFLALA